MLPKIRKIYKLEEFSKQDILYNSIGLITAILFILFGDWISAGFCILSGGFISIYFLEIDNCHEILSCTFDPRSKAITLQQRNLLSHGVLKLPLADIETIVIKSRDLSWTLKTRFSKNVQVDNQLFWIVVVLTSGEHHRLTYYETAFLENKQKMIDYILELKTFN